MDKIYHIYIKGECKYHSLSEDQFNIIWNYLDKLCWIAELNREDIDYEELETPSRYLINSIEH